MKLVIPAARLVIPAPRFVIPAKAGIQFFLAVLLAGCFGSSPPLPDDVNYRLQVAPATQRFEAPRIAGLVVVERPTAAAVYSSRDVVYSEDPPNQLSHYHYHHWADPPPQLLQQGLVDHLRSANLASNVAPEAGRLIPAYRISGVVRRFERQKIGSGWQAAVSLELRADAVGGREPLLLRQYEMVVAADGDGMEATVQAFAKATGSLFDRFVTDLNQALPAAEPTTARP